MLSLKTLGTVTRPRTAIAFVAATLIVGGTATEASAKSRHHHRYSHHHRHHAQDDSNATSNWRNANASMTPSQGTGRSFSGMASYYGNESGSRTASGARFNQNAMTAAHRSLPFGTKLRVTHGGSSVIVTTGAARAIGLTGAGVGRVTAEVVS
jgi:rare lipoprotein A